MSIHNLITQFGSEAALELVGEQDRRLVELAVHILGDETGDLGYLYSGFAMTGLPHRRPTNEMAPWKRSNGRYRLLVEPGHMFNARGDVLPCGMPFGSRARLILLYLQTEAIRTNSPEVRLGATMHDWLDRMGIPPGGTSYTAIRDQARRLSACRLTVGWTAEDGRSGFERANIVNAMMFVADPGDNRQTQLWDETARLSPEFYLALRDHPVPIAEAAIRAIQNSSSVMDIYVWLAYRLRALDRSTVISWSALHQQFGPEYKSLKRFKEKFVESLKEAMAVYPGAKVDIDTRGAVLWPSPPAVPERNGRRGLKLIPSSP